MTEIQALFESVLEQMLMEYIDIHPWPSVAQMKREVRRVGNAMQEQFRWPY